MFKYLIILLSIGYFSIASSQDLLSFSNQNNKERYEQLLHELRCLVCQNQNLADSSAGLAEDLKKEVYKMVEDGRSTDEIKNFLTLRYGDFVLYKPPFNWRTLFLWLGPFILLLIGFIILFFTIKGRQNKSENISSLSAADQNKLDQLLKEHKGNE